MSGEAGGVLRVARATLARYAGTSAAAANARASWRARAGLVLTVFDAEGRAGQGEASPLPGYSRESLAECAEALAGARGALAAAPVALGSDPAAAIARALDACGPDARAVPAARFALETALLDLAGQRLGVPLAGLLGGARAPRAVPLNALVTDEPSERGWVAAASDARARGIATVKFKVGRPGAFARELAALAAVRAAHGGAVALRLDANGAWTPGAARDALRELAAVAPEFVEEPTSGPALCELGACAAPWAADESLDTPGLAAALLARPAGCAAFVLKPARLGGLLAARALALRAHAAGLAVVVTHLFDGPIALAAACELALALRGVAACGLAPHGALAAWPACALPQLAGQRREVRAAPRVGLGLAPLAHDAAAEVLW